MRRVGDVEDFDTELQRVAPTQPELAEEAQVQVGVPGTVHAVVSRVAESRLRDRRKRQRIEPRLARTDSTGNGDALFDLIRHLVAAIQLKRRPVSGHRKWLSGIRAEQPVHLPAARQRGGDAAVVQEPFAAAERQLCNERCLEVVPAVVGEWRLVQVEVLKRLDSGRAVGKLIAADAERLRQGIRHRRLNPVLHPLGERGLQRVVVAPSWIAQNARGTGAPVLHEQRTAGVAGADDLPGVGVHDLIDVPLARSHVARLPREAAGQFRLHREVERMDVAALRFIGQRSGGDTQRYGYQTAAHVRYWDLWNTLAEATRELEGIR